MIINTNQLNTLKATAIFAFAIVLATIPFSVKAYATTNGSYSTGGGYPTTGGNYSTYGGSNSGSGSNAAPTSRPTVSTEAATGINYTKVTIQGAVHITSGTANAWFEWGTRVDALTQTTRTQIVTSTSTGIVETLTNLSEGTTYYYRVAARNERGISYGAVKSVTTLSKSGNNSGVSSTSVTSSSSNGLTSGGLSASAANAESSNSFVPTTFFGWLVIIILIFAIVVVIRMIQRDMEEKKKMKEEEEKMRQSHGMKFA